MTQVRFNQRPFEKSFNNLLDGFFNELPVIYKNEPQNWKGHAPVNIVENENSYSIEVVAPGFDKADFKVNIDQDVLTVSVEKKTETNENAETAEKQKQIRREYSYRSFRRSFTLDEKVNATAIEAKYNNGVLTLNLPKREEVKVAAQEINIQ